MTHYTRQEEGSDGDDFVCWLVCWLFSSISDSSNNVLAWTDHPSPFVHAPIQTKERTTNKGLVRSGLLFPFLAAAAAAACIRSISSLFFHSFHLSFSFSFSTIPISFPTLPSLS